MLEGLLAAPFVLIYIILFMLSGCFGGDYAYEGEYPELYTVAINSIPGTEGALHSEIMFDPEIKVIEQDSYGRVLFFYTEENSLNTHSLVISQLSDEEYSYFYPDFNFISVSGNAFKNSESRFYYLYEDPVTVFDVEDIAQLKEINDWEKEVDLSKCVKVKIVHEKEIPNARPKDLQATYDKIMGRAARPRNQGFSHFLTDDFGRQMYVGAGWGYEVDSVYAIMIFQPDGTCDIEEGTLVITDYYRHQSELKEFKERNGWNEPIK